ncbi:MAG: ATP-binding protein, partial [Bacteroidota bacterium]
DTVLFVNDAFLKTYGYDKHELLGKNISVVRSPNNPPEVVREILPTTLRGGWRGELFNRRKDGSEFPISLSTSVIHDDKGQPLALVGVASDITERKRSEKARRSLETQLQQAQKLESLGTLASGIAHDFNNILGIIIGHAFVLERLAADSAIIKKNTEAITKAGMRGAALVKQMLTFARKSEVLFESILLNDSVNEVVKLLAETFPKTITVSLDLEKDLPLIVADATQVHQVLLNLSVNARDAMPNGGTLTITTRRQSGEIARTRFSKATMREYIALSVADTGTGMDEATRSRIFEPFFTTKERGKGTGLGLSLVFGIMESHDGFVDVESEPGKGTTFHLYFPLLQKPAEIEQMKEQSTIDVPGGSETILVVEDEEMLRELVKNLLEAKGYTVLAASDGDEAVAMYTRHQGEIQLVLSDMGLPRMNGFEVYRELKNLNSTVRMILASGYVEPEMKSQILRAGVRDFIQKPYGPTEVLQTIRSVLDTA